MDTTVLIRASETQREAWRAAAQRAGLSLSAYLRRLADAASGLDPEPAPPRDARSRAKKDRDAP